MKHQKKIMKELNESESSFVCQRARNKSDIIIKKRTLFQRDLELIRSIAEKYDLCWFISAEFISADNDGLKVTIHD